MHDISELQTRTGTIIMAYDLTRSICNSYFDVCVTKVRTRSLRPE